MRRARRALSLTLLALASGCAHQSSPTDTRADVHTKAERRGRASRPNVLFLIADDLGAQALGCYGNTQCKTPAIDGLAARGTRFTRAYCQFPVCGPSRAALMSGLYPPAIAARGNGSARGFAKALAGRPTMTEPFRAAGYDAIRVSKIYHMRVPGDITRGVHGPDYAQSWTERFSVHAPEWRSAGPAEHLSNERLRKNDDSKHYNLGFGTAFYTVQTESGAGQADVQAADKAIEILGREHERPFFLAVGFVRPHVPLVAPRKHFERYDAKTLDLARSVAGDLDDIPKAGMSKSSRSTGLETDEQKRKVLAAYYASVSFLDEQVGRVLAALDERGLRDNTIVVFTSDHGYHLGEHEFWQKLSLHDESARIPLVISAPGHSAAVSGSLAQQIDLFPTLCELARLDVPPHCQGRSLRPVLRDARARVHETVYCFKRNGVLVRSQRHALLDWDDGSAELYDMDRDPEQFVNRATRASAAQTLAALRAQRDRDFRALGIPRTQRPGARRKSR